jgi:phospholipid/cholesterol/gamma-HCH transport system substrate-binding protein
VSGTRGFLSAVLAVILVVTTGCDWRGLNSVRLPGTQGWGPGSFEVQAQLANVTNIAENSRVRVADVTVGSVTGIARQGWHALVTMRLVGGVTLPENVTVRVGQTSLLGSLHIEIAPPVDEPPRGELHEGSLIQLDRTGAYPSTEQTLSAASMLLNGGGLGQVHDITRAFSVAFAGREQELRGFIEQFDEFIGHLDSQKDDILAATESLNQLTGRFAARKALLDRALQTIPQALEVLKDDREQLVEALDQFGEFSALAADSITRTEESLVAELADIGPVLAALADAGPALTRSLSLFSTFPWPKEGVRNWLRGDYANLTAIFDLTLSRLDTSLLTGTRFEGALTRLEMQWGRTIGQLPSPATAGNPLIVPYQADQGP